MKYKVIGQEIYLIEKEVEITQEIVDAIVKIGNEHSKIDKVEKISLEDVSAIMAEEDTDYDFLHRHRWQTWAEYIKGAVKNEGWIFGEEVENKKHGYEVIEMSVIE